MNTQTIQATTEQKTVTFENVTLYRRGSMFGINRTDCRMLTITTGQKYAQYDNAIRIQYVEKGKRSARTFMLDYDPWLRVVSVSDAIKPADAMVQIGGGSRHLRYASCDPRWTTDFEDQLAGVPILLAIGEGKREKCMRCVERIATTEEGGSHVCGVCAAAIRIENQLEVAR